MWKGGYKREGVKLNRGGASHLVRALHMEEATKLGGGRLDGPTFLP